MILFALIDIATIVVVVVIDGNSLHPSLGKRARPASQDDCCVCSGIGGWSVGRSGRTLNKAQGTNERHPGIANCYKLNCARLGRTLGRSLGWMRVVAVSAGRFLLQSPSTF